LEGLRDSGVLRAVPEKFSEWLGADSYARRADGGESWSSVGEFTMALQP